MHGEELACDFAMSRLFGEIARVRFKPRIRIVKFARDILDDVAASHLGIDSGRHRSRAEPDPSVGVKPSQ
jgi:hypothetical protein